MCAVSFIFFSGKLPCSSVSQTLTIKMIKQKMLLWIILSYGSIWKANNLFFCAFQAWQTSILLTKLLLYVVYMHINPQEIKQTTLYPSLYYYDTWHDTKEYVTVRSNSSEKRPPLTPSELRSHCLQFVTSSPADLLIYVHTKTKYTPDRRRLAPRRSAPGRGLLWCTAFWELCLPPFSS